MRRPEAVGGDEPVGFRFEIVSLLLAGLRWPRPAMLAGMVVGPGTGLNFALVPSLIAGYGRGAI